MSYFAILLVAAVLLWSSAQGTKQCEQQVNKDNEQSVDPNVDQCTEQTGNRKGKYSCLGIMNTYF